MDVDEDVESKALDTGRRGRRRWAFLMDLMMFCVVVVLVAYGIQIWSVN